MSVPGEGAVLADLPKQSGRTTTTLLASLAARLMALHLINGASAIGSIVSGLAALGREVARTADGARLRSAILAGRPGSNVALLWKELKIQDWAALSPASPILDHLRNDLALLLAPDLMEAIATLPVPADVGGQETELEPVEFVDCVLGLWAFAHELSSSIRLMAEPTLSGKPIHPAQPRPAPPGGGIMR